jgi:purine-nucleoside/S-methyl-5'-thioadenosine phosphorylase / adenosine deaminase
MPSAPLTHIPVLQSPLLAAAGFRHAFFTRRGGVSQGAYASLNFGYGVGDERAHVEENFRRAAEVLGVSADAVGVLSQVHGNAVHRHEPGQRRSELLALEGDALIAARGELACGVRTADCVPILLADPDGGSVAAVHAGWRGTVRRVIDTTLAELERLGARRERLIAAIGPHISLAAFEVGEDVAGELLGASRATDVIATRAGAKPHADLRRILTAQLLEAGLEASAIDQISGCTVEEPERFFSYRRDGPKSGRLLSAIVPRPTSAPPATKASGPATNPVTD